MLDFKSYIQALRDGDWHKLFSLFEDIASSYKNETDKDVAADETCDLMLYVLLFGGLELKDLVYFQMLYQIINNHPKFSQGKIAFSALQIFVAGTRALCMLEQKIDLDEQQTLKASLAEVRKKTEEIEDVLNYHGKKIEASCKKSDYSLDYKRKLDRFLAFVSLKNIIQLIYNRRAQKEKYAEFLDRLVRLSDMLAFEIESSPLELNLFVVNHITHEIIELKDNFSDSESQQLIYYLKLCNEKSYWFIQSEAGEHELDEVMAKLQSLEKDSEIHKKEARRYGVRALLRNSNLYVYGKPKDIEANLTTTHSLRNLQG